MNEERDGSKMPDWHFQGELSSDSIVPKRPVQHPCALRRAVQCQKITSTYQKRRAPTPSIRATMSAPYTLLRPLMQRSDLGKTDSCLNQRPSMFVCMHVRKNPECRAIHIHRLPQTLTLNPGLHTQASLSLADRTNT